MDVGTKIKAYIDAHDISQIELSAKTKIPAPKLNLSLSGKRRFTFAEYQVICWALGVGVNEFMEPRPPENAPAMTVGA